MKRYHNSRRSFSRTWNNLKYRYHLSISSFSEPSSLIPAFNFFLKLASKALHHHPALTAQHRLLSCLCRSRKRKTVTHKADTVESWKSKMQKTVQKNGVSRQAMDVGITFWVPQTLLKSSRCLPIPIYTLLFPASSTSRTQLHWKIHITVRHPPKSPNIAGQPHLLYFSRARFARKGLSRKHS